MAWHPVNPYFFHLQWMSLHWDKIRVERSLEAIGATINECIKTIDRVTESEEYADIVVDEECGMIEEFLGTAFVVCQTYITAMRSRVQALHRYHESQQPGKPLQTTTANKESILRFGSKKVGRGGYSAIQVIDAFANYFKHHDEWHGDWKKLKRPASDTAKIIMAVGAERGSTGNLRTASKRLGNPDYKDVRVFAKILASWSERLIREYAKELKARRLIRRTKTRFG